MAKHVKTGSASHKIESEPDKTEIVAKKFGVTKDDVTDTVEGLKDYVPDAGILLGGVLGGPIGLTLAVSDVIKRHTIDKWEEEGRELDELAELLARPLGASVEDFNKHVEEAKLGTAKLESELAHAGTDTDPIGTRFQRIKAFADVYLDVLSKQVRHNGGQEAKDLQRQNASPEKIADARQQTGAKVRWLTEQKAFFDGSGLQQLELEARKAARSRLKTDAESAKDAKDKAKVKNDNLQSKIQELLNQTGQGEYGQNDHNYTSDRKQIAEAEEKLNDAKTAKDIAISQVNLAVNSEEYWQNFLRPYDAAIFGAEQDLIAAKKYLENKLALLAQLQKKQDQSNQEQADSETAADQTRETAKNNEKAIAQLPDKIQFTQGLEKFQQDHPVDQDDDTGGDQPDATSSASAGGPTGQTGQGTQSTPDAARNALSSIPGLSLNITGGADRTGGLNFTPDLNAAARNIPVNFPGSRGAAGGRRVDPDRLNDILSGLILEQDALKKSLAESQKKQARMEQEIEELQRGHELHTRQIRSANSNRF